MKKIIVYVILPISVVTLIISLKYYGSSSFWESSLAGIICNVIIFIVGVNWEKVKIWLEKNEIKQFWSKSVFTNKFVIAYGALIDRRTVESQQDDQYRFLKEYPDHSVVSLVGPWEEVVSSCEIRAASYIINTVSMFRNDPIPIGSDKTVYANILRTIVAFGSPSSNAVTKKIMEEPSNCFFKFDQTEEGIPYILDKISGQIYVKKERGRDVAIVLKLKNRYSKGDFFFVCAGLGESGTSGAAWYLSNKWKDLKKNGDEFGIILEVSTSSDTSAIQINPDYGYRNIQEFLNTLPVKDKEVDGETHASDLSVATNEQTGSIKPVVTLASGVNNPFVKQTYYDGTNAQPTLNYGTTGGVNVTILSQVDGKNRKGKKRGSK